MRQSNPKDQHVPEAYAEMLAMLEAQRKSTYKAIGLTVAGLTLFFTILYWGAQGVGALQEDIQASKDLAVKIEASWVAWTKAEEEHQKACEADKDRMKSDIRENAEGLKEINRKLDELLRMKMFPQRHAIMKWTTPEWLEEHKSEHEL